MMQKHAGHTVRLINRLNF